MTRRGSHSRHPFMWIITIIAALIIVIPLAILFLWSFAETWIYPSLTPQEWGIHGYETILSIDPNIATTVLQSIGLSLIVAAICVVVSLLVGHALAYYEFKGKYFLDFLTFLPVIIPATAFGMGIHVFMLRAGIASKPLGVILVHTLVVIPYSIKILTDSLRLFGRSLSEQAWSLGASHPRAFFDVTLPPLLPSVITSFAISFIGSFGQYFLTLIIGGGKVVTLATVMFPWVNGTDRSLAAAFAIIYIASSLVIFILLDCIGNALSKRRKTYLM